MQVCARNRYRHRNRQALELDYGPDGDFSGHGQHAVVRNVNRGAAQADFAALEKAAVLGIASR